MQTIILEFVLRSFFLCIIFSTFVSAAPEAGIFLAPSITLYPHLYRQSETASELSHRSERDAIAQFRNVIDSDRFIINEIKNFTLYDFVQSPVSNYSLHNFLKTKCVPEVMSSIDHLREDRARSIETQQQQNSFMSDKANEDGFTMDELNQVDNSNYIYLPLISSYHEAVKVETIILSDTVITSKIVKNVNDTVIIDSVKDLSVEKYLPESDTALSLERIGIPEDSTRLILQTVYTQYDTVITTDTSIYRNAITSTTLGLKRWKIIQVSGERVIIEYTPLTYTQSTQVSLSENYSDDDKKRAHETGFRTIAAHSSNFFKEKLLNLEEFKLTGQVIGHNRVELDIDLNGQEVHVDDKFLLISLNEEDDGTISERRAGWLVVRKDDVDRGSLTPGRVVGGSPYSGMVVREKRMAGGEFSILYQQQPISTKASRNSSLVQNIEFHSNESIKFELAVQIRRKSGVPQLFLVFGGGASKGDASGSLILSTVDSSMVIPDTSLSTWNLTDYSGGHFEISLKKRFYIRRFSPAIQAGFVYNRVHSDISKSHSGSSDDSDLNLSLDARGAFIRGATEFALSPSFHLGIYGGYRHCEDLQQLEDISADDINRDVYRDFHNNFTHSISGFYGGASISFQPPRR